MSAHKYDSIPEDMVCSHCKKVYSTSCTQCKDDMDYDYFPNKATKDAWLLYQKMCVGCLPPDLEIVNHEVRLIIGWCGEVMVSCMALYVKRIYRVRGERQKAEPIEDKK